MACVSASVAAAGGACSGSACWVRAGSPAADTGVGVVSADTAAAAPSYDIRDLCHETPLLSKGAGGEPTVVASPDRAVDVEFHRDIKPILDRSCAGCHSASIFRDRKS